MNDMLVPQLRICADIARASPDEYTYLNSAARPVLRRAADKLEQAQAVIDWIDSWVSNPVGSYSVSALDGLFGMTRDKIATLSSALRNEDGK